MCPLYVAERFYYLKKLYLCFYPDSNPVPDVAPSTFIPIPSPDVKPSPVRLAASRIERVPSKKRDCVQDNKEALVQEQAAKRKAVRGLKTANRRAVASANAETVRLEGLDRQKKENMRYESMLGSDDEEPLPSPAAKLLSDSFAKGIRDAKVWNLRNNEEPDGEMKFDSGDDDEEDSL
jgi:hypothetical protein